MLEETEEKFDAMYTEAIRLQSFKNWPFDCNSLCSAAKMAEAGFFHCPTEHEPDLVQCYVCFKELDGWEATDEPWAEHYSHSKICAFAQMRKPQKDLTIGEIFKIESERKKNKAKRVIAQQLKKFRKVCGDFDDYVEDLIKSVEVCKKKK
ncbi:baculoviral IAP repeat-containing protein 5 [Caerostris darwini]|uniref:Baculoviral IAP repeat-containing protein 5 n=1 Tax=Caerostris darwini TaxID=1538125 RepID=A0AAV4NQP4_9ARAC|nr:baculoviral IAP repeat-containing protein 5 [Caerostris darwini]